MVEWVEVDGLRRCLDGSADDAKLTTLLCITDRARGLRVRDVSAVVTSRGGGLCTRHGDFDARSMSRRTMRVSDCRCASGKSKFDGQSLTTVDSCHTRRGCLHHIKPSFVRGTSSPYASVHASAGSRNVMFPSCASLNVHGENTP